VQSSGEDTYRCETNFDTLMAASSTGVCVHRDGLIIYANPAAARWIGMNDPAALIGQDLFAYLNPGDIGGVRARTAALQAGERPAYSAQIRMQGSDGVWHEIQVASQRAFWDGEAAIVTSFRDMSKVKAVSSAQAQAALVRNVSDAIIAIDHDGRIVSWNPAAERIYGKPADDVMGDSLHDAVGAPLDPEDVIASGGAVQAVHRRSDGSPLTIRVSVAVMNDGYVLVCSDLTALRRAEARFKAVVESLDAGVVVALPDGTVATVNRAAMRLFGRATGGGPGPANVLDFELYDARGNLLTEDDHPFVRVMRDGPAVTDFECGFRSAEGRWIWMIGSGRLLDPSNPEHSMIVFTVVDITARRLLSEQLAHQALHDPLTGLPNRTHATNLLAEALDDDDRSAWTSVLFVDLDNLKSTNDTYGHTAGDQLLMVVAMRMRSVAEDFDAVAARLSGDVFIVILPGGDRGTADTVATRLHQALATPAMISDVAIEVRASIGVVFLQPGHYRTVADVLRDADLAMYEAKRSGGATTRYFGDISTDRVR